ncbi:hypothetical protein NFI96_010838 [Prochilodus magdalenae]|nr:hypothetical protein NFI96_010838 [Prochilodus magdalenae]
MPISSWSPHPFPPPQILPSRLFLSSVSPRAPSSLTAHGRSADEAPVIIVRARTSTCTKMAASQGGAGAVAALQGQPYPSVPQWNPGVLQHQQPLHTARSLERALEDAVCSGILNISGRKLRDYPGLSYDLTDTTQAAEWMEPEAVGSVGAHVFLLLTHRYCPPPLGELCSERQPRDNYVCVDWEPGVGHRMVEPCRRKDLSVTVPLAIAHSEASSSPGCSLWLLLTVLGFSICFRTYALAAVENNQIFTAKLYGKPSQKLYLQQGKERHRMKESAAASLFNHLFTLLPTLNTCELGPGKDQVVHFSPVPENKLRQEYLSKNRFGEIPPEVCMFAPLESLNLYHNCIKVIPEAIVNLQMLTYLNISS